jgi:hypothetical protein
LDEKRMKKVKLLELLADVLVMAGFASIVTGAAMVYRPLAFVIAGVMFLLLARVANTEKDS